MNDINFNESVFRKANGQEIADISEYIINYLKNEDSGAKIYLGCDSINVRRKTMYVVTVVFYNEVERHGAHYVSYKFFTQKERDVFTRLYKEATTLYELGDFLEERLKGNYFPKSYAYDSKGRLLKMVNGHFPNDYDGSVAYKLCELHVDFNKNSTTARKHKTRGIIEQENKSHSVYNATMGMLCGAGFKVRAKPIAHAATGGADFLCHK